MKDDNMDYIYIGTITDTHGIKGELRIKSNFEYKDQIFKKDFNIYIGDNKIKETINTYRYHKIYDMVTLYNYDNINQVLKYLKQKVYVLRSDLNINKGYVLDDLINMSIYENNNLLGKVIDIFDNNGNILLNIKGEKEFYIPYNDNFIKKVDINSGKIEVSNAKDLIL
jgi:16S rRNA processing protein RimM